MIRDQLLDEAITNEDSFETTLGQLLGVAIRNGVDPRGSWVYRADGDGQSDLETVIVELEDADD